jgi:hypothetical protein
MQTYIYTYMHTYMHTCMHAYIHTYTYFLPFKFTGFASLTFAAISASLAYAVYNAVGL